MIDSDMISDFVEESRELLDSTEEFFLELEKNPDAEKINTLFRAVHTIKGTSGFLGLENIGKLSHTMENIMAKIRDGSMKPDAIIIDALLQGNDLLKDMIRNVSESDQKDISGIVRIMTDILENKKPASSSTQEKPEKKIPEENKTLQRDNQFPKEQSSMDVPEELLDEFIFEAGKYLTNLEEIIDNWDIHNAITQESLLSGLHALNALKSSAEFIGLGHISLIAEFGESLLQEINRENSLFIAYNNYLFMIKDKMQTYLDNINEADQEDARSFIQIIREAISGDSQGNIKKNEHKVASGDTVNKNENALKSEMEINDSIRIHLSIVDRLMRLAGELVLIRNQQLISFQNINSGSREIVQRLDGVTSEIQETIMKTRLQPIGNIVNKFPRFIRELNKKLDKKIEMEITGAEVELDRTIIESLAAPLTHLIRNSADHGIELPQERIRAGKRETGLISIFAYHEGGLIHIKITDDGRGMNLQKIKQKAIESGIVNENELAVWSENEIINLVMRPGFSTAEKVSDVSGRGVGMDVVKSSIERLNGSIEIKSMENVGSEILIKLPLTLAIIPSLIVISGDYRYAIPQVNLEELVTIGQNATSRVETTQDQEVFRLRDFLLPVVRLDELLGSPEPMNRETKMDILMKYALHREKETRNLAVLVAGNKKYGMIIDQVLGTEEIVVKPMHNALKHLKVYSGATILGDGKIALILDAEGIGNHYGVNYNVKMKEKEYINENSINESVLIFRYGEKEQFGLSLHLISRIKEISAHDIQKVGNDEYVHFDNKSNKIIRLDSYLPIDPIVATEYYYIILFKHINKPAGIIISELIDIRDIAIILDEVSYKKDGVLGTSIINDKITIFPDIYRVMELAEPEWFSQKEKKYLYADKKALVVYDSSIFRSMISKYLREEKFLVTTATDGKDALQKWKTGKFDLIISDLEMPVMDGFGWIAEVRNLKDGKDIPAIALSSLNKEDIIEKAKSAGFDRYEIKIEREHFIQTVYSVMEEFYG